MSREDHIRTEFPTPVSVVVTSVIGNDSPKPITLPIEVVKVGSVLHKMMKGDLSVNVKKSADGAITVDASRDDLVILVSYLLLGDVDADNLETLMKMLDYFDLFSLKAEYPQEYLVLKLREEWYRRNLYNPYFATTVGLKTGVNLENSKWSLVKLTDLSQFKLAEQLHLIYAREIFSKKDVKDDVSGLIEKDHAPLSKSKGQKIHKRYLKHVYDRPPMNIGKLSDDDVKAMVKKANDDFKARDAEFDHKLIRETIRRRPPTVKKDESWLDYNHRLQLPGRYDLDRDRVIKCLQKEKLFHHVCLAGGNVLNRIIDCRIASDYDLFLHDVKDDEAANAIVLQILTALNDKIGIKSIMRSEHAMTIRLKDSQPHGKKGHEEVKKGEEVQIIFRLYRNISEIIHGFDVDCCCVCYDGKDFWATQRAVYSITHLVNFVDFDRASPSYEMRLAKYLARGFSCYIPDYNKKKIRIEQLHKAVKEDMSAFALTGIDVLLYHYYKMISPAMCKYKSDYTALMCHRNVFRDKQGKIGLQTLMNKEGDAIVAFQLVCDSDTKMIPELALDLMNLADDRSVKRLLMENATDRIDNTDPYRNEFLEINVPRVDLLPVLPRLSGLPLLQGLPRLPLSPGLPPLPPLPGPGLGPVHIPSPHRSPRRLASPRRLDFDGDEEETINPPIVAGSIRTPTALTLPHALLPPLPVLPALPHHLQSLLTTLAVPAVHATPAAQTKIVRDFKLRIPEKIMWKRVNPGEQATSTFHQLVLKDTSEWYNGKFYRHF